MVDNLGSACYSKFPARHGMAKIKLPITISDRLFGKSFIFLNFAVKNIFRRRFNEKNK